MVNGLDRWTLPGVALVAALACAGCRPATLRAAAETPGAQAPAGGQAPAKDPKAAQPPSAPQAGGGGRPRSIAESLDRGLNWLITRQNPDGGYGPSVWVPESSDVGLTAFALYALTRSPRAYKEHDGPYVSKAVEFLLSHQKPSGAFYDERDPSLQNYKTSVVILALLALDRVKYRDAIKKAEGFVKSQQFTEAESFEKDKHLGFGGVGYGGDRGRADMSNTSFGAEALHQAGLSGSDELWARLQVFLGRCQNLPEVDPLLKSAGVGTTGDGGWRYGPNFTRGPESTGPNGEKLFSSYGSMTYAGLKSLLYAQVDRKDPRVQAAFDWIRKNFTVKENPGMALPTDPLKGQQGLFYYYHTMAKALAAYGEPVIEDAQGNQRLWAKELAEQIVSLQKPEGFWDNPAERWMEGIEVLDTSYAMVALTVCQESMRQAEAPGRGASLPAGPGAAGRPPASSGRAPAPGAGASPTGR